MTAPPAELVERLTGEAHLWLTPFAGPLAVEDGWPRLLPPEELAANRRFRVAEARRQHLTGRALVRTTLSRYVDVDPRRWRFHPGPEGRPEIHRPAGLPPLRFNLSHTRGLVACLVTLGFDCGVDVERPGRQIRDPLALARHSFAPVEQRALGRLTGDELRRRFFELWTLKEAYVKARGAGFLSLPARRFAWEIDGDALRLTVDAELGDAAEDWQAALVEPRPGYRLAAAVRRGRRPDLTLAAWEAVPLAGEPQTMRPEVLARSAPAALAAV